MVDYTTAVAANFADRGKIDWELSGAAAPLPDLADVSHHLVVNELAARVFVLAHVDGPLFVKFDEPQVSRRHLGTLTDFDRRMLLAPCHGAERQRVMDRKPCFRDGPLDLNILTTNDVSNPVDYHFRGIDIL